ncbi:MAG: cell division protein FtsH, partial [Actinomycetia bacterium]|nr:cell division protein FtsH [Actinomycetes bacterium]
FREPTTGAVSDIEQATKIARAMVTEYGMSSKLGAVRYGTEHGDPFLGRTMGAQADYSHEIAQIIDDEVRKLIEAAHTEAWEILTEYRDVLDILAGELLEKETLHRVELEAIGGEVKKRPRLTMFDDFGGRVPSDKPPIKTPGELAIERGEPWPKPVPEPAFKAAIAEASRAAAEAATNNGGPGSGANGGPTNGATQPDYGAPAGWHAPGWPPQPQPPGASPQPPGAPPQPPGPPPQQASRHGYPTPPPWPGWQGGPPVPPASDYRGHEPRPHPGQPAPRGGAAAPGPKEGPGQNSGTDKGRTDPPPDRS